jgi:hypothetical protein
MRTLIATLLLTATAACSDDASSVVVGDDQSLTQSNDRIRRALGESERIAVPTGTFVGLTGEALLAARVAGLTAKPMTSLACADNSQAARQDYVDAYGKLRVTAFYRTGANVKVLDSVVGHLSGSGKFIKLRVPACYGLEAPPGLEGYPVRYSALLHETGPSRTPTVWACNGSCTDTETTFTGLYDLRSPSGNTGDGVVDLADLPATDADFEPFKRSGWTLAGSVGSKLLEDTDGDGFFDSEMIYATEGGRFTR